MKSLQDLFEHEIKDLYSAESQLIEALPVMAKTASTPSLQKAFESHLKETEEHRNRLSQICKELGVNPGNTKCNAMEGLIEEGEDMVEEDAEPVVKDAGLIACAQRVEHYEIAGYGTAHHYAKMLGHDKIAELLATTLEEERDADEKLNDIAIEQVNKKAM